MVGLTTRTVVVSRFEAGEWVKGVYEKGAESILEIQASVQPLDPNELLQLPEGRRTHESIKIFTDIELHTANTTTGEQADMLEIDGIQFEIHKVERWMLPGSAQNHYKVVAVKRTGLGDVLP